MARSFDDVMKKRFLEQISRGKRPAHAAEGLGFTFATVRKHLRDDPAFAEGYEVAGRLVDERVEEVLYDKAVEDGDLGAIKMWLTNRRPNDWKEMSKQAVGAGTSHTTVNIGVVSTTALRELLTDPDPEVRASALAFSRDIPAIEATATEVA